VARPVSPLPPLLSLLVWLLEFSYFGKKFVWFLVVLCSNFSYLFLLDWYFISIHVFRSYSLSDRKKSGNTLPQKLSPSKSYDALPISTILKLSTKFDVCLVHGTNLVFFLNLQVFLSLIL
jgi:hypothetical protein